MEDVKDLLGLAKTRRLRAGLGPVRAKVDTETKGFGRRVGRRTEVDRALMFDVNLWRDARNEPRRNGPRGTKQRS